MARVTAGDAATVRVAFEAEEADLLRRLAAEMRSLLGAAHGRRDRVVGRLFPDAYEDASEAAAYRDLTAADLRDAKLAALAKIDDVLGDAGAVDATIPAPEVEAWLTALTDIRLAIGTRIDVTEERMAADLEPDHPDATAIAVLHWLGWVQELLLDAVDPSQ